MSSKKFGPALIIDLTSTLLQRILSMLIHGAALQALWLSDLSVAPLLVELMLYLVIAVSFVLSLPFRGSQNLIISGSGKWYLEKIGDEREEVQALPNGLKTRFGMVLNLKSRAGSTCAHLLIPAVIGQECYRRLLVMRSIQGC